MSEHRYAVEGMTCRHCVAAVTEEVSHVPGAEHVEVDLEHGSLTVRGDVSIADVRAAVEEAGYSLL